MISWAFLRHGTGGKVYHGYFSLHRTTGSCFLGQDRKTYNSRLGRSVRIAKEIMMLALRDPNMPFSARWLGFGGLLPFVGLALAAVIDPARVSFWNQALMAYGAIILSFVGALHWAFAMTASGLSEPERTGRFVWSVMPALIAWAALLVSAVSVLFAVVLLLAGFWLHYLQDRVLARRADLPAWYLPLRLALTSVASLCILVGGIAAG